MLKKINAAGRRGGLFPIYYETITREGNLLKKVATPKIYNTTSITYPYPFYDYVKEKESTYYHFYLKTISYNDFIKQIFPDIQYDGVNYYTEKPFLLANAGGESVNTNLKINSLRFKSVNITTVDELEVDTIKETENKDKTQIITEIKYKPIKALDNFPGYDTTKDLYKNLEDGVFENCYTVETESFEIVYTKQLNETRWKDNATTVTYSPYAILKPSLGGGLFSVRFMFASWSGGTEIVIEKREERYKDGYQATESFIY